MNTLLKILLTALAVFFLAAVLPGVAVENYISAITVALVIGLLNIFVRPIIVLLTLPATIFSLGLFLIVINAGIILLADKFVDGFMVAGFFDAVVFSVLLSIVRSLLVSLIKEENTQ
ncbi:MAG: phage holin family protein [Polaribacter sp.]|mgnify:FL=1|jgi:putative membrane protein|nr:phage holin family protein [Polaribacter sp.]MDP4704391.1 phage holin family protein [Polaribacter sp.]